jgi:hypothetical protein
MSQPINLTIHHPINQLSLILHQLHCSYPYCCWRKQILFIIIIFFLPSMRAAPRTRYDTILKCCCQTCRAARPTVLPFFVPRCHRKSERQKGNTSRQPRADLLHVLPCCIMWFTSCHAMQWHIKPTCLSAQLLLSMAPLATSLCLW